jgi:hypothetical protein
VLLLWNKREREIPQREFPERDAGKGKIMTENNIAEVSADMAEVAVETAPAVAEVTAPAVELPAWMTLAPTKERPEGYVLKQRDILANCVVRDEVTGVVSQNWAKKEFQLHADHSACLKKQNPKSKIMSREWMIERLAEESVKQEAGLERGLYFCTRCVIEFRPTPKVAEVESAEVVEVAEVAASPEPAEAPAAELEAPAAEVAKPSPAPRRRRAAKVAAE